MSVYHRLISYIYAYEGGVKGKNTGFAKLETRGTSCRIQVSVRRIFVGASPIGVYLLAGQEEIRIGTLFVRGGNGEFRTVVNSENIEGSGCSMEECCGLTIHETDSAWRAYTTIWEDAVAHAAEVELADVTAEKVREQEAEKAAAARKLTERARKSAEKEAEILAKNETPSQFERVCVMEEPEAFETEAESSAVIDEIKSTVERATELEESKSEKAAMPVTSVSGEKKTEEEIGLETLEAGGGEENEGESAEAVDRVEVGESSEIKGSAELLKETNGNGLSEGEISLQEESEPASISGEMLSREAPDMPSSGKIASQKESGVVSDSQETASWHPSRSSEEGQAESSNRGEALWNRLRTIYPKVTAFECTGGCEILVIKPQDIGLLPRENWVYGNNSFLLHGYYNYRYLIVARLGKSGEQGHYILGVPGHYGNNEKYMAAMFGFDHFVRSTRQPPRDSRFGYWYTDLNFT